jgi:hypothetical protein
MGFDLPNLIDQYKAPDEFDVTLPAGEVFKFRAITSHSELVQFRKNTAMFVKSATSKLVPEEWKPYTPIPAETAQIVYMVAELSVEPKLTQLDVLQIAKHLPFILETFNQQIEFNRSAIFQKSVEESIEAGKDE